MNLRDLREMAEAIKQMNGRVEVGVPASASGDKGVSLALIAAVHEFGSLDGRIPQRSFLRPAIEKNLEAFKRITFDSLVKVAEGRMPLSTAFGRLGQAAVSAVKTEMTTGSYVPLKPATIKRKGSSRPLIDTGNLRQSITYVVTEGG